MRSPRHPKSSLLGGSRARDGLMGRLALCAVVWLAVAAQSAAPAALLTTAPVIERGELAPVVASLQLPSYLDVRAAEGPGSGVEAFLERLELHGRPGGFAAAPDFAPSLPVPPGRRLDAPPGRPTLSVGVLFPYRSTAPPVA